MPVSSPAVAEMVKLLENTFRAVNIGLVNELALMSHKLGSTFGKSSRRPHEAVRIHAVLSGPGARRPLHSGGSALSELEGTPERVREPIHRAGGHVNGAMPEHVVERVSEALNSKGLAVRGSRVHLFGVAYKPDVGDVRESPALDIIGLLHRRGAIVTYTDPYVRSLREGGSVLEGIDMDTAFERGIDCAVITTNHRCLDYQAIAERSPLVVDTRNALRGIQAGISSGSRERPAKAGRTSEVAPHE